MKDKFEPGSFCVNSGGSWVLSAWCARTTYRAARDPSRRNANLGLRLVRRCP